MSICYIYSGRFPTEKAHGYQVVKMCEAFSIDHEILLLYPRRRNSRELRKMKDIFSFYAIEKIFPIKRIFCFEFSIFKNMEMQKLWFHSSSLMFAIYVTFWIIFQKKNFDIIYSRSPYIIFFLTLLKKYVRSKIVYEIHTFSRGKKSGKIKLARKVDKIVVVTGKIKELFVKAGIDSKKIIVEPDAVDLKQFDLKISKSNARSKLNLPGTMEMISYVGQFHTMGMDKGIPEIIKSAGFLVEKFPRIKFYFVGGPLNMERKYRDLIGENHLPQDRFFFLGRQPVKEIPLWLKASDVLLMPFPEIIILHFLCLRSRCLNTWLPGGRSLARSYLRLKKSCKI
jgi:glycosyltransferase involved in cell wall biosynthesis